MVRVLAVRSSGREERERLKLILVKRSTHSRIGPDARPHDRIRGRAFGKLDNFRGSSGRGRGGALRGRANGHIFQFFVLPKTGPTFRVIVPKHHPCYN
jgi:hypothetical protein